MPFGDNVRVSTLEREIDDLFALPLAEFTRARNALAKTVRGADATRVRTLAKPTVVAWSVNQVYWRARPVYDRLMRAGEKLRQAQIAALTRKPADVRDASDTHRRALADAVKEAERLASEGGSHPAPDALMRTFETLSIAKEPPAPRGRLTDALQPAGFEALAGVTPKVRLKPDTTKEQHRADERKRRDEEKARAAEERQRAAAVKKAEARLARAREQMRAAEEALRRTQGR